MKQIASSVTAPGTTGGNNTHTHPFSAHGHTYPNHTHTGSWGTSGGSGDATLRAGGVGAGAFTWSAEGHTHTSSSPAGPGSATNNSTPANTDTTTLDPFHVRVIFIKSDGSPAGIPVNGVVWFNGATPSGFSAYSTLDSRLMKGAVAGGDGGGTGGTDPTNHNHTTATHTHPQSHTHVVNLDSGGASATTNTVAGVIASAPHTHVAGTSGSNILQTTTDPASETTGAGDSTPSWRKMRAVQKTTSVGLAVGMIAMWDGSLGSIPVTSGWQLADGTGSKPQLSDGRFVMGTSVDLECGTAGGSDTHVHAAGTPHSHTITGTHTHTLTTVSGASSGESGNLPSGGLNGPDTNTHTHQSTTYTSAAVTVGTSNTLATTQQANSSNNPTFTEIAYIQMVTQIPDAPTINTPIASTAYSSILGLDATVTDPDVSDTLFATFEYDRNDNNWTVIGNGSTVANGGRSTRSWDISALAPGFNYRVRAKATDNSGAVGPYTTTATFIIGPGYAGLYGTNNTSRYNAENNTQRYYAASQTAIYRAEKA